MILHIDFGLYSGIEFKQSEDENWIGKLIYGTRELEICIQKEIWAQSGLEPVKTWEVIKWGLDNIFKHIKDLIKRSNTVLFKVQKDFFNNFYWDKECCFEPETIVITNVKTAGDNDYHVDFKFVFIHSCPTQQEDVYYDYSCRYNISKNKIALISAQRNHMD